MHRLFGRLSVTKTPQRALVLACCVMSTVSLPAASLAQVGVAPPKLPINSAAAVVKPAWADLNAAQQQSLKPLAASWNGINEAQKRKWLEISKNYPKLSAAEQVTMHSRMVEWVAMSPQDRAAARLNFAKTKELSKDISADEKKAKWETYQTLSPVEKANLAAKATPKPVGAATAIKPVPPQKLAATPKNLVPPAKAPAPAPVTTASESPPGIAPAPAN